MLIYYYLLVCRNSEVRFRFWVFVLYVFFFGLFLALGNVEA